MIPVPYLPKEQAAPLQRVLEHAAQLTGLDEHTLLIALSGLSEATADEVSRGHSVRWPAFGMFSPALVKQMRRNGIYRQYPRCKPVFSPTRTICTSSGGNIPLRCSGPAIDSPALIESASLCTSARTTEFCIVS